MANISIFEQSLTAKDDGDLETEESRPMAVSFENFCSQLITYTPGAHN